MTNSTRYIIQTASASMPASCWGRYGKIAVLEVDSHLSSVSMISERARGCHRVIAIWDRQHIGKTEKCAYWRAYAEAETLVAGLNADRDAQSAAWGDKKRI